MSNNYHEKFPERNEQQDSFNLSREDIMNCFGSQIASQSSKSKHEYENEYNPPNEENRSISNPPLQNLDSSNVFNRDRDGILRNICHGFIDIIFNQNEELKEVKDEVQKLQNILKNNGGNSGLININNANKMLAIKKPKINNNYNNQNPFIYNQNNNLNNNDNYNYFSRNSKKNLLLNSSNNNINIFDDPNKRQNMPILAKSRKSRTKSKNHSSHPKSKVPETVQEVDEEFEFSAKQNPKNSEAKGKINKREILMKNNFDNNFSGENPEENAEYKYEDVLDNEFDELMKGNNQQIKNKMLMNDPFKKSSDLQQEKNEKEENKIEKMENLEENENNNDSDLDIDNDNYINQNKIEIDKENDKNLGMINLDLDEMPSDFMAGGKKITVKLNDNVRKKLTKEMSSLDEPINIIEELSKNKQPSNIIHNDSKLSSSSILLSKNKELNLNININNNSCESKKNGSKLRPGKRNYNTMKENYKNEEEERNNGSSVKERGYFAKKIKKFGKPTNYNLLNNKNMNIRSNPTSQNLKINTHKKIKNKKYMFSTISTCEFYCLCQKQPYLDNKEINLIENSKCKICKNSGIINIKNFKQGFYYYVLHNQDKDIDNIKEIKINDSIFKSLGNDTKEKVNEKSYNDTTEKDLEQFFNYQFNFLAYDKNMKISREKENNSEFQLENLIEDIYSKLIDKYIQVFVKAKRSFLTEVAEGDSSLGYNNISLFLMNIANNADPLNGEKVIEFSDGFKSCFAVITQEDPINNLMEKMILHNWMNVEIGMSKVLKVTEDFKIFIKIYYNSISSTEKNDINNIKYGPLTDKKKILPKNILDIRNDGGEISSIKIILVKKYDFYVKNATKNIRYARRKYENEIMKIPESSEKKNNNNSDSEEKNNKSNNKNEKEPDILYFHFKAIAVDYEIYSLLKKGENNDKHFENLLKKRFTIEFYVRNRELYETLDEGKTYQLLFLNLENKNSNNNNLNINANEISNSNKINKKYYKKDYQENNIQIRYYDKSQIIDNPNNLNYKADKAFIQSTELINKSLSLTNNIDIGKLFVETEEFDESFNHKDYLHKEFTISGIYSGYVDKVRSGLNSQNNEANENNGDEYVERYIFLSLEESKIAIIKLHKEDFFCIDVKSSTIQGKMFKCSDIIFNEIIYFDDDNNQPKITGKKRMENSIPLLNLKTNNYTSINIGNYNKNKEQLDSYINFRDKNKKLVEMLEEVIG